MKWTPWKTSIEPGGRDDTFQVVDGDRELPFDQSVAENEAITLCTCNVPEFERMMSLSEPRPRTDFLRLERQVDWKVVGCYGWTDDGSRSGHWTAHVH